MPVTSTPFSVVYNRFLAKITDDMYMEITPEETEALLQDLLISAIPWFEFPRINLNLKTDTEFLVQLSEEEINILSIYMIVEWIGQQLATIELIRMKYSGSDFKFTSQANHIHKLKDLQKEYERKGFHLQRLYKRRKADKNGIMRSTFGSIMESPSSAPANQIDQLTKEVRDLQKLVGYQSDDIASNDEEVVISGGGTPLED